MIPGLDFVVPHSSDQPYDILDVIRLVVDEGNFFEIMPDYARNIVVGFARMNGRTVGVVANQPNQKAGMYLVCDNKVEFMSSLIQVVWTLCLPSRVQGLSDFATASTFHS